jgi:ectoine hydroxylase-related dioxygenase (phytanoyl-CoA dioxygenase family)
MHAQTLIRNVIEGKALALLDRYQFVSGSFVAKHPGERSRVQPHTDLTFVDPQHYSAIAVRTPLTEINPDSGPLHVLPGSHQYTPMSGSNLFKSYEFISISEMVSVNPRIGQAVCYDVQLVHASPANKSVRSRIATNSVLTPIAAQLLHLTQREGRIYRYAVDPHFYATRGGDEIANQALLMRYPVLDSQPVAFDQDYPSSHSRKIRSL